MHSPRPALSGPLHVAGHIVLLLCGWGLFAAFWWVVVQQPSHRLADISWLIAGALILLPIITLYWVVHNRGIYARKGPRRQVQVIDAAYTNDWTGRTVRADFDHLAQASLITIDSSSGEKHYLATGAPPSVPHAS